METNKLSSRFNTSDILAGVAVLVSILALYVSFNQLSVQEGQYDSQKVENQPIFYVTSYHDKVNNDSINDTEILSIKNIGREVLQIGRIQCETFIQFEEAYPPHRQTLYIPIIDYFASHADQPRLIGEVITDITEGNFMEFERFRQECEYRSVRGRVWHTYTCYIVKFVIIKYTDIYKDEHTVYFENGQICSKDYYDDIVKKSRDDFQENYFSIHQLHFDDLKKYRKIGSSRYSAR